MIKKILVSLIILFILIYPVNGFSSLTGIVHYNETNGSQYRVNGVFINVTHITNGQRYENYSYTGASGVGFYTLTGIPDGNYIVKVNYSTGLNMINESIILVGAIQKNWTLNFSKPFMSNPVLTEKNTLKGYYSNDIIPINLWSNPNYVWGKYVLDDGQIYIQDCNYIVDNIFECDNIPNTNYEFNFIYSDIYNTNLDLYHPAIVGTRNFSSGKIYIINNSYNDLDSRKIISRLGQKERENYIKNYFWEFLFLVIIIIGVGYLSSHDKR